MISVIIPAYNEEGYIAATLHHLHQANGRLQHTGGAPVEFLLVDNGSTDSTARIAQQIGTVVVPEPTRNIAKARNTGARAAHGDVFVFMDADVLVPEELLARIADVMNDSRCIGGAVDTQYLPNRLLLRAYLQMWRFVGKIGGLAQGATQFCRRGAFFALGGYDESIYMGEDVDFYWRLRQRAKSEGLMVRYIGEVRVVPSCRRFNQWPIWRTLVWTNPVVALLFRRRKSFWQGWYQVAPR